MEPLSVSEERKACISMNYGFHFRPPPSARHLRSFLTDDKKLFETIHMGSPEIDLNRWMLLVDGLVKSPFSLSFSQLQALPSVTITAFHECFGSPLKPPKENPWRIGNVEWTGVRLSTLLAMAQPTEFAEFVWTDGLDHGNFAHEYAESYQKDLPIEKASRPEVLVAYKMNGALLRRDRGGPVRLVVPGWFGTNSTKWLCHIALREQRSLSLYTTRWYNVPDPETGRMKPVWAVEPNSIIVSPVAGTLLERSDILVEGWAWSDDGIIRVEVTYDNGLSWHKAEVQARRDFSWQGYRVRLKLPPGKHRISARATSTSGLQQPIKDARNHVHTILVEVRS